MLATSVTSREGAWIDSETLSAFYIEPAAAANTIPAPGSLRRETARRETRVSAMVCAQHSIDHDVALIVDVRCDT